MKKDMTLVVNGQTIGELLRKADALDKLERCLRSGFPSSSILEFSVWRLSPHEVKLQGWRAGMGEKAALVEAVEAMEEP